MILSGKGELYQYLAYLGVMCVGMAFETMTPENQSGSDHGLI
jgi:hypothetical protein